MIYDLDVGRAERPGRSNPGMTVVTVAMAGVSVLVFAALAFWPGDRTRQTPLVTFSYPQISFAPHPSFATRPVPDRRLTLAADVGTVTYRITYQGQTGLVSSGALATTYRLRASGDLVTVSTLPLAESWPYTASDAAAMRVRGRDASWIVADNGTSVIRWIENGVSFEVSSRTLGISQLAELANRPR